MVTCVQHRAGWCALAPDQTLDPLAWSDETACGEYVVMRMGSDVRDPTCPECVAALAAGGPPAGRSREVRRPPAPGA